MQDLVLTNDPVLLNYVEVLLADQGIQTFVFDRHMSIAEGQIGVFPRRLQVASEDWLRAAGILKDAELGAWVKASGSG